MQITARCSAVIVTEGRVVSRIIDDFLNYLNIRNIRFEYFFAMTNLTIFALTWLTWPFFYAFLRIALSALFALSILCLLFHSLIINGLYSKCRKCKLCNSNFYSLFTNIVFEKSTLVIRYRFLVIAEGICRRSRSLAYVIHILYAGFLRNP